MDTSLSKLCVESSLVLLEEGVCYDQCVLLAKLYVVGITNPAPFKSSMVALFPTIPPEMWYYFLAYYFFK